MNGKHCVIVVVSIKNPIVCLNMLIKQIKMLLLQASAGEQASGGCDNAADSERCVCNAEKRTFIFSFIFIVHSRRNNRSYFRTSMWTLQPSEGPLAGCWRWASFSDSFKEMYCFVWVCVACSGTSPRFIYLLFILMYSTKFEGISTQLTILISVLLFKSWWRN